MIIEKSIEAIAGEAVSKLLSRRITYLLLIVGMSCYFIGTQTSTFLDWTTSKVSNVLASQGYHWTNHLGKGQTVWVNYEGAPLRMDATSGSKKTETLSKGTTLIFLSREDGANKIKVNGKTVCAPWVKVQLPDGSKTGYIFSGTLSNTLIPANQVTKIITKPCTEGKNIYQYQTARMVRLREQPNTKSKELKILKEGIVLSVIDFSVEKELITDCDNTIPQHWMAVQGSNSKILGWVYGGCLKLLSPSQNNTNSKTPGVSQQGFYASKY